MTIEKRTQINKPVIMKILISTLSDHVSLNIIITLIIMAQITNDEIKEIIALPDIFFDGSIVFLLSQSISKPLTLQASPVIVQNLSKNTYFQVQNLS